MRTVMATAIIACRPITAAMPQPELFTDTCRVRRLRFITPTSPLTDTQQREAALLPIMRTRPIPMAGAGGGSAPGPRRALFGCELPAPRGVVGFQGVGKARCYAFTAA